MDGNYSDERVPCKICGRSFAPEVLTKHASICKKTASTASKRKPFDSSKQRVLEGELSLKQIKQAQKKLRNLFRNKQHSSRHRPGVLRAILAMSYAKKARLVLDSSRSMGSEEFLQEVDCSACGDILAINKTLKPLPDNQDIKPPKTHWREQHQDFINAVRSARGVQHAIDSGGPLPPPPPPSINPDYIQCPYCSRRFNAKAAERHIQFCKEQQSRLPRGKPNPKAEAKQNARLNYQVPKPKSKASPAASPANVPAARPGARPAPTSTRTPAGGASRGRAAPAPETEDSTITDTDLLTITINETGEETSVIEYETVSALPFAAWQPPLANGSYTPSAKVPKMSAWPVMEDTENFPMSPLLGWPPKGLNDSGIPLGTLDLRRKDAKTDKNMPSLKTMLKNYIGRHRCQVSVFNSRGGGSKPSPQGMKGRQEVPQGRAFMDDPSSPYPSPHSQQQQMSHQRLYHLQQQQLEPSEEALLDYKPSKPTNPFLHNQMETLTGSPGKDFFISPEDFYTPFENIHDHPKHSGIPSPRSTAERSRKADGVPVKSKLYTSSKYNNYLNKMTGENNGMPEEDLHTSKPRTPINVTFCHECGSKYPVATAKFCCQCGVKKVDLSSHKSKRHSKGHSHMH